MMQVLTVALMSLVDIARSCMPPLDYHDITMSAAAKAFGEATNKVATPIKLDGASATPTSITDPTDLFCYDFNDKCHWRNVEGVGVDDLDWFQGSGFLDESRLRLSTGTHLSPDGFYSIAASDKILFPTAKAVLVSDTIDCQLGQAELRFMFWTSPEVKLVVCTKALGKALFDFDYCAQAIENGDPGPAYVSIPDLGGEPFQIFIRAENFVFHSLNLQGGFAIIDSIEYYGEFCPKPQLIRHHARPTNNKVEQHVDIFDSHEKDAHLNVEGDLPHHMEVMHHHHNPDENSIVIHSDAAESDVPSSICEVVDCSFNATEFCTSQLQGTGWMMSALPTADLLGGIPGDASQLPFNRGGSFAVIMGPQTRARFQTKPFNVDEDLFLMFAYFKSVQIGDLKVFLRKEYATKEELLFTTPKLAVESHRWFREVRPLYPGRYDYVAVEVVDIPLGFSVGLDEIILLDRRKQHYCRV